MDYYDRDKTYSYKAVFYCTIGMMIVILIAQAIEFL